MIQLNIIKKLLNKESYNKYISFIKPIDELKKHYKILNDLHTSIQGDLTLDDYVAHAEQNGCDFLDTLRNSEVSEESLDKLVKTLCERSWAHELAILSLDVSEGRKDASDLSSHYDKLSTFVDVVEEDDFVTDDLEIISQVTDKKSGLQFRLPTLREQLGGQKQGSFGVFFGRNNTGKTTLVASELSFFAKQTDKPVIWFNNEQEKHVVQLRLMQAALGWTNDQMMQDTNRTQEEYRKISKGNIKLVDMSNMHKSSVERIVKTYEPAAIVLDSIDAIKGFKADRKDVMFGDIYNWARMLAKDHCAVIGICQASISAENKRWLLDSDLEEAKTSKPTEVDWLVGIGKTFDAGAEDIRYLHICKDKFNCQRKKIECRIQPDIARYIEL